MEQKVGPKTNQTSAHLKALLKKNMILMKRNVCGTCCELLAPIMFALLLVLFRSLIDTEIVPQGSYVSPTPSYNKLLYSSPSSSNNTLLYSSPSYYSPSPSLSTADLAKLRQKFFVDNMIKPCNDHIALIQNSATKSSVLTTLASEFAKMQIKTKDFSTKKAFEDYVSAREYDLSGDPVFCLGIQIDRDDSSHFEYQLRMNVTYRRRSSDIYQTSRPREQPLIVSDLPGLQKYQKTGFLALQNWIDNLAIKERQAGVNITPRVTSMSTKKHTLDRFVENIQRSTDFFIVLPLIGVFQGLLRKLLNEKENRVREGMKMMGMTNTSFYLSWIITYFLVLLVISISVSCIFVYGVASSVNFNLFFWIYLMFGLVLISQAILVSVFFTRSKPGLVFGSLFFLLQYLLRSFVGSDASADMLHIISLAPHTALPLAINTMLSFQFTLVTVDFSNYDQVVGNYSIKTAYDCMAGMMFFYLVLSIYLDQVFPNEFGQKKHPLFFLHWLRKDKQKVEQAHLTENDELDQDRFEKVDQLQMDLSKENKTVHIKDLTKIYGSGKKAVDRLNLNMYLNQIFVLLGHNGAGKTSTISMLTGLLGYSSGEAQVFGMDIATQMPEIRQTMGVCPQHDILFDQLTVKEHLQLFSTFKGAPSGPETDKEVEKMIQDLGLQEKKDQLAKNLSGGQKRRLSVGIAFIGNSKFIVLDEPTSGMDTSARRHIWEMLKNFKNDRIILLTTHFMDEADNLGDRIAIMSHGKLECCGSSVFLKNKFGVGYNLTISKKDQQSTPKIKEFIQTITPEATRISDVSSEEIYQLPLSSVPSFETLFTSLDSALDSLGIESYGISITTLEEVFLSVNSKKPIKSLNTISEAEPAKSQAIEVEDIEYDFQESYLPALARFNNLFWVLVWKRLVYFKRDIRGLFMELVIPTVLIILGCSLLTVTFITYEPALVMQPSVYSQSQNILYGAVHSISNLAQTIMSHSGQTTTLYSTSSALTSQQQLQQFDEYQFSVYSRSQHAAVFFTQATSNTDFSYVVLANTIAPEAAGIFLNCVNQAIFRQVTGDSSFSLKVVNNPMPLTYRYQQGQQTTSGILASMVFSLAIGFIPASIIVFIVKERESKVKHQQLVSGVSLAAYWLSNFFVDFVKYLIFAVATLIMIQAFEISVMTDSENYWALVLVHIFNGSSMIAFLYFIQFLFKTYSSAQLVIFVLYNVCGTILSIMMLILNTFKSTQDYAVYSAYVLRLFPCFTYGYSLVVNTNIDVLAFTRGEQSLGALAWINNGIDIFYLGITTLIYMALVFFIELVQNSRKVAFKGPAYQPHQKDSDVAEEEALLEKSDPKDYPVMVRQLRKVYRENKKVAVDQVSFGVPQGGVFGLLGVNGAGKTTTFKMLTGDISASAGEAYIYGLDISGQQQQTRQYIGYCPQFDALLENVTVEEHLKLYAAIKCIPQKKRALLVRQLLHKMDLVNYQHVLSKELSGGNKRKLSVAIAMLGNPPVIFLDEPSTGMDPQARRFMWTVISNISTAKKQCSVILTTHSMEEAEALCTKMGIMVNGELKCLGNIQRLKNRFGQGYELEVKFKAPSEQDIQMAFQILEPEYKPTQRLNMQQVQEVLTKLGMGGHTSTIAAGQQGSHLEMEMKNRGSINIDNLVDYAMVERRGSQLLGLIHQTFGDMVVIEHFSLFYRIKVLRQQKVGQLFGFFTQHQEQHGIEQYSIKQTSIEQIFNSFAKDEIGFQMQQQNQEVAKPSPKEIENVECSDESHPLN